MESGEENLKNNKVFEVLQRVGRSFMLPIAILPVAGLFLGIGSSFTNETMLKAYGLYGIMGPGTIIHGILTVMSAAGSIVFDNLPLLFAIGVAIGMAKREKEVAALASVIAFFIMHTAISALISVNYAGGDMSMDAMEHAVVNLEQNLGLSGATSMVLGIYTLNMGVFGGIIVGLGTAALHNRFYKIQLPQVLSFFGGTRFVPIISAVVFLLVGILMYFIWPYIQKVISMLGNLVQNTGYIGTLIYGIIERALIPFGLHHVFYMPFWQTNVGGSMEIAGQTINGAQNIFFAQLADPNTTKFSVDATRFMAGKFPFMMFGLPGAALAMYRCARNEKKKVVGGLLLSAALTAFLTGITEPLEFTFLFVAPILYVVHCVLAGISFMLMHIFGVGVGMTFSGGLIDMTLFGIMQGNAKTHWLYIVLVGIVYFFVYWGVFTFLIKKFNFKTPGREADNEETKLYTRSDVNAKNGGKTDMTSVLILKGLGGKENIADIDCCATRLRITVYDTERVNDEILKQTGSRGIVKKGQGVQIIYGPHVTVIKSNLEDYLETAPDTYAETTVLENTETKTEETTVSENAENETKAKSTIIISSPITGNAADLSAVPDEAFAGRMMGDGAAVTPTDAIITAPEDGEVAFVFDTKHAIGFETESGVELLIHVGVDTVSLNGEGFEVFVENGQKVKKGDVMMKINIPYLTEHAPSLCSPVLCTDLDDNQKIRLLAKGEIKAGEPLFAIDLY